MAEPKIATDKANVKHDTTSIISTLSEKQSDINLSKDCKPIVNPHELETDQLSIIMNTSFGDHFVNSTIKDDSYLSEDDEFDLQKIKQEALYVNYSSNFKSENSLDINYNCSSLNVSTSFEMNANSMDHPDMFIHEEVFSDNFNDIEGHSNGGVPLDIEICKTNMDDTEKTIISSVLIDHNYIGQEINTIRPELSIKSLNDLKNYSLILNRFIANYEQFSNLKSVETEVLIEEMAENLNIFKNSIGTNLNKVIESIQNVENIDPHNTYTNQKISIQNNDKTSTNENLTTPSEIERKSIIISENCSEPLEFRNNLLEIDNSINGFCEIENSIVKEDDDARVINKISEFGLHLVESCKIFNSSPNRNLPKFVSEKLSECKKILVLTTKTVSVQTDYSGKIYSEKRLKKINDDEKYRLLKDSSSSYGSFSDDVNINESFSSESDEETEDDSTNSYNGIDLSQYIEKSVITDITENTKAFDKQDNNSIDVNKEIQNSMLNPDSIHSKEEDKDDVEEKAINRLLDFKSLANKKISFIQYIYDDAEKSTNCTKTKPEKLLQILDCSDIEELSDGSCSDVDNNLATEKEFLVRRNEDFKQSLLNTSSSDSDACSEKITLEKENNDSNTSLVLKFLEAYENENEDVNQNYKTDNQNIVNQFKDAEVENTNNETVCGLASHNKEHKIEDLSEMERNNIFDKSFTKKAIKEKSFESLLTDDVKRRKYSKYNEELISLSSEESDIEENKMDNLQHNRILRPMMRQDQLASETKVAQKEENNRILRLKNKENILKKAFKEHKIGRSNTKELILDYNLKTKKFIKVHPDLFKHLKEHQIEGIKFMYDACYGSVNFTNEHPGSGCILAHCMGLGKTLQLIALLHTVICNKELKTARVLVLCPKSTVMNWADEIQRWLAPLNTKNIKIFTFSDTSDIKNKLSILREWASSGCAGFRDSGCLLIGYEAFRTLVSYHTYRKRSSYLTQSDLDAIQKTVKETLLQPGADLVVCDEGHIIKNRKAAISQAVTEITTRRRIVLTGTPIQNNLKEYYSMVNFIKPSFLGTEKEFANLYANPIRYGQHKDSSKRDIKIMKQRSFVLHKKLSSFVQRREAALLKTFLPQKFEYVLFIPLSKVQSQLYEIFLESVSKRDDSKGRSLLTDYTCLRKIWTHPKVLENAWLNATMLKQKKEKRNTNLIIQSDDEEPDDIYDSQTGLMSVTSDWWRSHLTKQDLESIIPSNKLQAMFEILKMCEENREKCLIFSAFVAVLNVVEYFMQLINEKGYSAQNEGIERFKGPWINGKDYYRLDGKTPKTLRHEMVKSFNNPNNNRARVFLISAKAGGQGINLTGANRVLILDTSWNPSNDQQNIFRIFRLGQTRNCYIYRLIALGTMEEKVYSRSVTKQAMSFRVVDEHQIDRHYSMAELAELYTLTYYGERPVPFLPQDSILANLLRNHSNLVYKYHEHDSLLENKIEQELSEQEKEDAWLAYERDTNYNPAVTGGVLPTGGVGSRFDVFGPQTYMPAMDYVGNNLQEIAFNQMGITQHSTQPQFLSSYGFPGNDSYLDSMYKMYQNAQNYSSSMIGMDNNTNGRVGISSNTLTNYSNTLPPFGNIHNISTDMSNTNPSHYGTPIYSSSAASHFGHPSLIENLKKTFENYTNNNINSSNTGPRIQKAQTSSSQNNNSFQSSFINNDIPGLSGASTDAIPTSVIMKNDLLLKQFNDQIKSTTGSNNHFNLINKANTVRTVMKSGKFDSANCFANDNLPLVKAKKKPIAYKSNSSTTGTKSHMTESQHKTEEGNSLTEKSSGIFLIENQTNANRTNDQTIVPDNISTINSSMPANNAIAITQSTISLPLKSKTKQSTEVTNNKVLSPTLRNPEIQTNSNILQNTVKSSKFPIVESEHLSPTRNLQESNIKIKCFTKPSQTNQITNNEKQNNILPFSSSTNQNIVITKVHDTKGKPNLPPKNLATNNTINSNLLHTGKGIFRNTTISNLVNGNDKSIVNKFVNSDVSITPTRKRINSKAANQAQQMPQIQNVTSQLTKQSDTRTGVATSLQQSPNFTSANELVKRQKLHSVSKTEANRVQNIYKI